MSIIIPPHGVQEPLCDYCGHPSWLVEASAMRARHDGLLWACFACEAWVEIHEDSPRLKPMGRLANAELRAAKHEAHVAFDLLWKWQGMARDEAYVWLSIKMGLPLACCHIAWFDVSDCKRVITIMRDYERSLA